MSQLEFLPTDVSALFPEATSPRAYLYPSCGITGLGVGEWTGAGAPRRVVAHHRLGRWQAGYPARRPERGWPLYGSDRWASQLVYLVATEREAAALERMGLDATTWIGATANETRWSDWGGLDGRNVCVWTSPTLHRPLTQHLWRHRFAPKPAGAPLDWLKAAWERHNGDRAAIREEILWWESV